MTRTADKPLLIVICGPTASGKTALAVELAQELSTIVISADSRQFYREMRIGTAAPSVEEQKGVPHYFIHHLSVHQPYNASMFAGDVLELTGSYFSDHSAAIMAGGSGLYIDMVVNGMDPLPDPDPEIRQLIDHRLKHEGIEALREWLRELDPDYYRQIDLSNPKRLQRAIEVCLITGKPYSQQRTSEPKERNFRTLKIGLDWPREELFDRISRRTDSMIESGLVEEVKGLMHLRHLNSLQTVGYRELFRYLDGEISLDQAITDIKTNTRRYAKRQLTWFKRDTTIRWLTPDQFHTISTLAADALY